MSNIEKLTVIILAILTAYYLLAKKQIKKWVERFSDHFSIINDYKWSRANYPTDDTVYIPENVKTDNYTMLLLETKARGQGAEIYTNELYSFGKYRASIKFPDAPNVMGAFYLFSQYDDPTGVDEIDIESVPDNPYLIDFVLWKDSGRVGYIRKNVPFKVSEDFHEYIIEWSKDEIIFFIDGTEYWRYADKIKMPVRPCRIIFNSRNPLFLGDFSIPGICEVDYIYHYIKE